jgi:uncharacterized protein YejL (UPF0352 family)
LPFTTDILVTVTNTLGQNVLANKFASIKKHTLSLDVSKLATGNYIANIESQNFSKRIRFIVAQ